MSVRVILLVAAFLLVLTGHAGAQFAGRKIMIDAGHGGADPGAVGIDGGAYPNEEDFVLDVAQRLKAKLEAAGAEVILTRNADADVSLTWLRLTTAGTENTGNPVIDFRKRLSFDMWTAQPMKTGLGLRETASSGAIGSDGGITGPIEFAGVSSLTGSTPVPVRTVPAQVWTTLQFDLPAEPVRAFTGNGVLESATGLGVLEHLALVPANAALDHEIFLDNFVVVEPNTVTWSLTSGPAGATIDAATGRVMWTPSAGQLGGTWTFTVRATDAGTPPVSGTRTFTVRAVPLPKILNVARTGGMFSFSWSSAQEAIYQIESATNPSGPWTLAAEMMAGGTSATWSGPVSDARRFYRARLKP